MNCTRLVVLAVVSAWFLTFLERPAAAQLDNALTGTTAEPTGSALGGFDFELTLSDSSGLNAVGQNYRNELSTYFEPRWAIGDRLFGGSGALGKLTLSGRFVLTRALSGTGDDSFGGTVNSGPVAPCSNVLPSSEGGVIDPTQVRRCNPPSADRRIDYSDLWLTAGLPRFATIPRTGLDLSTSLRLILPTSVQSRYATLRFGLTGTGGLSRAFFGDKLRLIYTLGVTKNFHAYSTPGIDAGPPGPAGDVGANPSGGLSGTGISNLYADPTRAGQGGFNVSFSLANSLSAHFDLSQRWSGDVLYLWTDAFTYGHRCQLDLDGLALDSCATGAAVAGASGTDVAARGHKRGQVFWVTASYSFRPWLSFSLAWVNWAPREKPDTSYRQPFISTDYNAFTSVMLSATTSLEEIAKRWRGTRNQGKP
jgi:hypothetical protein